MKRKRNGKRAAAAIQVIQGLSGWTILNFWPMAANRQIQV